MAEAEDIKIEAPVPAPLAAEEQKEKGPEIQGPRIGIDEKGYLLIQAHMSMNYLALRGWIDECKNWLEDIHPNSLLNQRKKAEKEKEEKIILPPKGGGRFNLFRGK